MNEHAAAKILMIQSSTRCLVYGLLALLPGIGLPFGILALWHGGRSRVRERKYWNPAKNYRIGGVVAASIGLIFWALAAGVIACEAFANLF